MIKFIWMYTIFWFFYFIVNEASPPVKGFFWRRMVYLLVLEFLFVVVFPVVFLIVCRMEVYLDLVFPLFFLLIL